MSFQKSTFHHPRLKVNDLGLTYRDYCLGALSTSRFIEQEVLSHFAELNSAKQAY